MASIARQSPNGRRGSSYSTREWVRRKPAQASSRSAMKRSFSPTGGVPASRSIGPTATCPPLTTAALKGPYSFEITAHEVAFRGPDDSLGVLYSVFLAVEEITKHVYAEGASATPEKAGAFLVN